MKKLIALLLAMAMVLSLAACGAQEEAPATTEAPAANAGTEAPAATEETHDPVTLTCWAFEGPMAEAYEFLGEEVNAKYPWITLEWEFLPADSGPEKFTVACATGTTPDIYVDGFSRIAPAVAAGLCIDLTDVIADNSDVFLAAPKDGIVDGKNYYLPIGGNMGYGLMVNMDLAEELGVADMLPADYLTWSYEDFLALCRAVKAADPTKYPVGIFAGSQSSDAWYYTWLLGNGSKICNADLTATDFNSDANREASLEVLTLFKTLIDEELTPPGSATMTDQEMHQFWYGGQTLMAHCGFANVTYFYNEIQAGNMADRNYHVYAVPTADGKQPPLSAQWGTTGIVGFNNNGNEEAIKLVLDYFLDTESTTYQKLLDLGCTSAYTEAKGTVNYAEDWITEQMNLGLAYSAEYAVADFGIMEPWWTEFRQGLYPQLQDFYTGKIDAQAVLDNWQAFGDNVINNAKAG